METHTKAAAVRRTLVLDGETHKRLAESARRSERSVSAEIRLMPRLQAGIEGGFQAPPEETAFEVRNQQSARR